MTTITVVAIAALVLASASSAAITTAPPSTIVDTDLGPVKGVYDAATKVSAWRGVPYAADTGGSNRFRPPQPRQPWGPAVRDATTFGPGCEQFHHNPDVPKYVSEDCLLLNIYRPETADPTAPLPVYMFAHGGAFNEGSGEGPFGLYDGRWLTGTRGVLLVTINYRLGAFGWVAVDDERLGNYGLMDQVAAMQWIQRNIANFGGDPHNVTIAGESAGAMSVGIHLTNPDKSKGLFHRAVMESNVAGFHYRTAKEARDYGRTFCKLLSCTQTGSAECDTGCLENKTAAEIHAAWDKAANNIPDIILANLGHWLDAALACTPTIDGEWIKREPMDAVTEGVFADNVDVLIGTNQNEGVTFIFAAFPKTEVPTILYEGALEGIFGVDKGRRVIERYKNLTHGPFADARFALSAVITDYWWLCSGQRLATAAAKHGGVAYFYHFDHVFSSSWLFSKFGLPTQCENATCHAEELPFLFQASQNPQIVALNATFTPDEVVLEENFGDYWMSFARGQPPSSRHGLAWPVFSADSRATLVLRTPAPTVTTEFTEKCRFWDEIGYDH